MLQSSITPTTDITVELLAQCDCFVRFQGKKLVLMGSRDQVANAKKLLMPAEDPESDVEDVEDEDE